jgi:two-component system sensor histidine kinase UhpB
VQESLTNATRHAQARRVDITLGEVDGDVSRPLLTLQIEDDGRGIDPAAPVGRGLRGMQERAQALSGSCVVERVSGAGTRVRIAIPIASGPIGPDTDAGAA